MARRSTQSNPLSAGEYKPDTCAYCQTNTWCEQRKNGKPQCRACKIERFFELVLYRPLGFSLLWWQRQELRKIYGKLNPEDGARTIRHAFISMAKKNAKSFCVGGLPIYHMVCEPHIFNQEAYGAAAAKDQAGIVFRSAATLVNANPLLKDRLRIIESTKRIVRRDGGGFYQVISADGDVQDGVAPSLVIMDEIHRWTTERSDTLFAVLTKGMSSRNEALAVRITTAGDPHRSQLWRGEYEYAKRLLDGSLTSDRYHAAIWEADQERLKREPDYWMSREARVAANPSHEDLGGFLKDENIAEDIEKSKKDAKARRDFYRLNLNVSPDMLADGAIDPVTWRESGGPIDLREWPVYDVELIIKKLGLLNATCFASVDASWTTDLTAVALDFPPEGNRPWVMLCFCWMPQERLKKHEQSDKVPYRTWADQGFLELTDGNAVDYECIKDKLRWARQMFDLQEVAYDPWNFRATAGQLVDDGFTCIEVQQSYSKLSAATKQFLALYPDNQLWHLNNPLVNWCASCVTLSGDKKDNVMVAKPERAKSSKRIDPIAAAIMAMSRAMDAVDNRIVYTGLKTV